MLLSNELVKFGLSQKEAAVYVAALELGYAPVQEIAKKSGVKRVTTYVILESLMKKGIASTFTKGKKTFYVAESPERLKIYLQEQKRDIEQKEKDFLKILPELRLITNISDEKPKVKFYEGKEGLFAMNSYFLKNAKKEAFSIYSVDDVKKIFSEKERKDITKKRIQKGIFMNALYTSVTKQKIQKPMGKRRYVPLDKFPFSSDITVYGDYVRIATLRGKLSGVIIQSKEISKTIKSLFDLAWQAAAKYNK